jgi:tetratricopeptide (TPR) repeat protein
MIRSDKRLTPLAPSAEVADFARGMRNRFILALKFSVIAGVTIPVLVGFPFAFFLLILAGYAACAIAKIERTATMQLFLQQRRSSPGDRLLEKVKSRRRRAEEAARRLQEQYDREAGSERWGAKRDELLNQKETYENLAHIRQFRLQQLEAQARRTQLVEFLDQFEINDSEIKGIVAPIKAALLSHGVETAADVIEDVSQIPSVGRSQAERLLEWRRDLERRFAFEPARGVPPEARVKTEREVDALRFSLESELSGGAHYLRRVKQEIETGRQKLQPALTKARQELAQAEKDLEVADKRNSPALILTALIIAFFIGWAIHSFRQVQYDYGIQTLPGKPPLAYRSDHDSLAEQNQHERSQEALKFYREGLDLSRAKRFAGAANAFQKAVEIDSHFYEAYEELGYALYRLGRYEASIDASRQATISQNYFTPYYNIGLAYLAQKDWGAANYAFERAITRCKQGSWIENYSNAYYYRGLSLASLGQANTTIETLEKSLELNPTIIERFELATLYLGSGRYKDARAQYRILKDVDPELAEELLKLIKKHSRPA